MQAQIDAATNAAGRYHAARIDDTLRRHDGAAQRLEL